MEVVSPWNALRKTSVKSPRRKEEERVSASVSKSMPAPSLRDISSYMADELLFAGMKSRREECKELRRCSLSLEADWE